MQQQSDSNRAATSRAMKRYWAKYRATHVKRCTTCKRTPTEVPFYAGTCSYCKDCFREKRRESKQ
jgi:hypothetical protein